MNVSTTLMTSSRPKEEIDKKEDSPLEEGRTGRVTLLNQKSASGLKSALNNTLQNNNGEQLLKMIFLPGQILIIQYIAPK